ncbi:MAG: hypothetical protein CL424_18905 [Acidimicrobiaceae bacterium]|nr:hypothetical protein [Acidimicrobiaceae bacterium]
MPSVPDERVDTTPSLAVEAAYRSVESGEFDAACELAATAMSSDTATVTYEAGRAVASAAALRGGYRSTDFELHSALMKRTIRLEPSHQHARYHLIRVAIRAQDWPTAFRAARAPELAVAVARDHVGWDGILVGLRDGPSCADAWFVASWYLHAQGQLVRAHQAKVEYARAILAGPPHQLRRARALAFLERYDEAVSAALAGARVRSSRDEAMWLVADIGLADPSSSVVNGGNSIAPLGGRLDRWYRRRSVVVVGPTAPDNPDWSEIAEHEVIVAPKLTVERAEQLRDAGARTIITYLTGVSEAMLAEKYATSLDVFDAIVVRPNDDLRHSGLRSREGVTRSSGEPRHLLDASSFAIPRIAYDVLRSSPAQLSIRHADLFVTGRYDEGYRQELNMAERTGIVLNLDGYGHDLVADHQLLASLKRKGLIDVDDRLAETLRLAPIDYLTKVQANRSGA